MAWFLRACVLSVSLGAVACGSAPPRGLSGAYQFSDQRIVSIRPSVDDTLRYREFETGRSGRLHPDAGDTWVSGPGFSDKAPVTLRVRFQLDESGVARSLDWMPSDGDPERALRVGAEREVRFDSDGTELFGRLHLPDGPGPHPAVILVHGSGESPGSDLFFNGDFMVPHGIAVLAFDKRGTGRSDGDFTSDFHVLARDVAAAVAFLRSQPEIRPEQIGLSGYSQGGWVAPLAASMSPVRFVLVSYGMIESPSEEARLEMRILLERGGVSGDDLEAADALVTAAVNLVANRFESGWEEFRALRKQYRDADWLRYLDGTPVDQLMTYPRWLVNLIGPGRLPEGLDWRYDSVSLLESSCVPMTWFLGLEDDSAPNSLTIPRLQALRDAGKPYDLVLFPGADHGILLFREEDGQRVYTGYAPEYFRAEVEAALKWLSDAEGSLADCR